jgi:hypothetical protein
MASYHSLPSLPSSSSLLKTRSQSIHLMLFQECRSAHPTLKNFPSGRQTMAAKEMCFCVKGNSCELISKTYTDSTHMPCRVGKFRPPSSLEVSSVTQRCYETLDLVPGLQQLAPDVQAVFHSAAEMGLPPQVLCSVLKQFNELTPRSCPGAAATTLGDNTSGAVVMMKTSATSFCVYTKKTMCPARHVDSGFAIPSFQEHSGLRCNYCVLRFAFPGTGDLKEVCSVALPD